MTRHTPAILSFLMLLTCLPLRGVPVPATPQTAESVWSFDPAAPNKACPINSGCETWLSFRKSRPWPYQTIAVKEEDAGDAVIVISEPPPTLTRVQYRQLLTALFGSKLTDITFCRWPTGLDGYLEDIVVKVRATSAARLRYVSSGNLESREGSQELIAPLRLLYRFEYGTPEGFSVDPIEDEEPRVTPIEELKVPVDDLASWIAQDTSRWAPLEGDGKSSWPIEHIYGSTVPGSYVSSTGIVVLAAPKGSSLSNLQAPFRDFAVASDLIIGAMGRKNGMMLLFARQRKLPLAALPPLRFETFAGFARNRAEDVAQSYERQRIFAGRIQSGEYAGWDWAPILLSPQLDDTEFGTLLNLADQMLKSWSQHGQVEYYAFDYPKPASYPFADQAASEYFETKYKTASLLFNWNTDNFSAISRTRNDGYLTSSRTGALRVLYRPSNDFGSDSQDPESLRKAEQDADERAALAQNYFASLGNQILIRVVQNTLLYQAEQSFLTIAGAQDASRKGRSDLVQDVLAKAAEKWLLTAKQHRLVGNESPEIVEMLNFELQQSQLSPAELAALIASPQKIMIAMEKARQDAVRSASEHDALAQQADDLAQRGEASFRSACMSLGGSLTNGKQQLECNWKQAGGASENSPAFNESHLLEVQFNQQEAAVKAARERFEKNMLAFGALNQRYKKASRIGKVVTLLSGEADLDLVLAQVLQAGASQTDQGFIRTPSVVLSRNDLNVDSVGGHNISLTPPEIDWSPTGTIGRPHIRTDRSVGIVPVPYSVPVPDIVTGPRPAPRPVQEVLGKPPSGTLLDLMREKIAAIPISSGESAARVRACDCDAIVTQRADGTIHLLRTAPPPVETIIQGKSLMIDAVAGPPPLKVIAFDNFSERDVDSFARTQALLNHKAGLADTDFSSVEDMFSGVTDGGGKGGQTELLLTDQDGEPVPLIVSYIEQSSPHEPIRWNGSQVSDASSWKDTFGSDADASKEAKARIIVKFGPPDRPGALGVSVASVADEAGMVSRLKAVVTSWLVKQPATPQPVAASVLSLRATIMARLKPSQLQFFLTRNMGVVRVAEMQVETRQTGQGD